MVLKEDCFKLLKQIPKAKVTTYKELGRALNTKGYRGIGQILKRNKNPDEIPCFKVVKSNGEIGGYYGGLNRVEEKIKKLKAEGIEVVDGMVDLGKFLYKF